MMRMIPRYLSLILIIMFVVPFVVENGHALNEINGWILPTDSGDHNIYVGYGAHYEPGGIPSIHLGQDFEGNTGDPVYAIADGNVIESRTNVGGYGPLGTRGGALVALFTTSDGLQFKALYGHINNPHPIGAVTAGEVLGNLNDYRPSHLHFGIHPGADYPSDENPWRGFIRETDYAITNDTYGWVDPIEFLETHTPETNTSQSMQDITEEPIEVKNNSLGQDAICLATALMSEASIGTHEERVAVAWTIFNRVDSQNFPNTICEVVNQRGQYATNQEPTQELLELAASLIADRGADPTGGTIYFFSPISMPKEGEPTGGYDVGGGLHEVAGIDGRVYFPSWALTNEPVGEIPGIRPNYYMFYRDRPANDQVTLSLYVHDGSADGPVLSGVEVTGQDAVGNNFSQTTNEDGFAILTGEPGNWQLTAAKAGYAVNSWSQEIMKIDTKHAFLYEEQPLEYARTNEFADESMATCDPGVISANCSSPDACVDCNGECHSSGSNIGNGWVCNQGLWSNVLYSIFRNPNNGHYYKLVAQNLNWSDAKTYAESQQLVFEPEIVDIYRGHLATITSLEESSWIMENIISSLSGESKIWLGGYQDESQKGEPAGDWHWVTDEPWSWTNWNPGEPNDDNRDERYLELWGHADGHWNDEDIYHPNTKYLLVEYEI